MWAKNINLLKFAEKQGLSLYGGLFHCAQKILNFHAMNGRYTGRICDASKPLLKTNSSRGSKVILCYTKISPTEFNGTNPKLVG